MSDPRMEWFDAVMYGVEDDPLLRSVITMVLLLDTEPDEDVVRSRIDRMTLLVPRLRQRAVGNSLSPAPPRWEVDTNFDLDYHLRFVKADRPDGTMRPVFHLAQQVAEQDFDHARPLWEALVINGLSDGQTAFVFKIHHSITDGVAGMQMAAAMFDLNREADQDLGTTPEPPVGAVAGAVERLRQGASFEARTTVSDARSIIGKGTAFVKDALTDPIGMAAAATEFAQSAGRVFAPVPSPMSPVFGERSLSVYFDVIVIPLDDLRRAGKAAKGTLNDAFVAGVVGGLRTYHERHGLVPDALRINMPVNLRSPAEAATQGNRWLPARFAVPLNEPDPARRVHQMHPLLRQARTEPAFALSNTAFRLLTLLPRTLATEVAGGMMKGTDFVATNVTGPPVPVYFAGAQVLRMLTYAPKAGAAVNCALMSYAGDAQIGINIDTGSVPDPQALMDDLRAGLHDVVALGQPSTAKKAAGTTGPARRPPARMSAGKRGTSKKAPPKKAPPA